jgi:hypothetical protein
MFSGIFFSTFWGRGRPCACPGGLLNELKETRQEIFKEQYGDLDQ